MIPEARKPSNGVLDCFEIPVYPNEKLILVHQLVLTDQSRQIINEKASEIFKREIKKRGNRAGFEGECMHLVHCKHCLSMASRKFRNDTSKSLEKALIKVIDKNIKLPKDAVKSLLEEIREKGYIISQEFHSQVERAKYNINKEFDREVYKIFVDQINIKKYQKVYEGCNQGDSTSSEEEPTKKKSTTPPQTNDSCACTIF